MEKESDNLKTGDFIWFMYDTKEIYPGRVMRIEKDDYLVEICTNKRKSEGNEVEHVKGKRSQLRSMVV